MVASILVAGCANTASPDAATLSSADSQSDVAAAQRPPISDAEAVARLNEDTLRRLANKTLTVKQLEAVLSQCDQYIAAYQQRYGDAPGKIFSARSEAERSTYLGFAKQLSGKVEVTVLDATWSSALYLRGYVLIELKRYDEAVKSLEKALALGPFNAQYLNELGFLKQQQQWFLASLYYHRAAKEVAPIYSPEDLKTLEAARAIRGIGSVYIDIGKWDEARAQFLESLVLEPDNQTAKNELRYIDELKKSGKSIGVRPTPQAGATVR